MGKYATGHAFSAYDLFINFPTEKLRSRTKKIKTVYPDGGMRSFAAHVFMQSALLVVKDIIENNTLFKLPVMGRRLAYILMKRTTGDKFTKAFKRGKWRDVDFIASNFTGYELEMRIENISGLPRTKSIYIDKTNRALLTEYTNLGKLY